MIPGDIDLTENLDFRKVVRKDVPQLPDLWSKKETSPKLTYLNESISIINGTIPFDDEYNIIYEPDSVYDYVSSNTYNFTYNNSNMTITYYNTYDDTNIQITNASITRSIQYTISNSSTFSTTNYRGFISWNDGDNITYSSSSNKLYIKSSIDGYEYDVFGNRKISYEENIPQIPWSNKSIDYIRRLPWNKKDNSYFIPDIPWDEEDEYHYKLSNQFNRAKHLIGWLSDRTRSFIEEYFRPEEDNLSYLTNMHWIRVKDAIID